HRVGLDQVGGLGLLEPAPELHHRVVVEVGPLQPGRPVLPPQVGHLHGLRPSSGAPLRLWRPTWEPTWSRPWGPAAQSIEERHAHGVRPRGGSWPWVAPWACLAVGVPYSVAMARSTSTREARRPGRMAARTPATAAAST